MGKKDNCGTKRIDCLSGEVIGKDQRTRSKVVPLHLPLHLTSEFCYTFLRWIYTFTLFRPPPSAYRTCRQQFPSRNALFVHFNAAKHFLKSIPEAKTSSQSQTPSPGTIISSYAPTIIASNAPSENVGTGAAYKDFSYCEIQYKLTDERGPASWGCTDTGSGISLVDKKALDSIPWWEKKNLKKIEAVVGIKGVGDDSVPYTSKETIVLNVFLPV